MADPAVDSPTTTRTAHPVPPWRAQPGDLLGGRYRLTSMVAAQASELWKAQDEVLARQVCVRIGGGSIATPARQAAFVGAAAAAGQASGPGMASVYDAATEPAPRRPAEEKDEDPTGAPGQARSSVSYVIAEWVEGLPLDVSVREQTMNTAQASWLVSELCTTVAQAHELGTQAGRLHPGQVVLTAGGNPKLTDLAVAAVVHAQPDAPTREAAVRADTCGLARVLYAALTGYWPEPGWDEPWTGLAPAPRRDGRLCLPREVTAGLPRDIDGIVARTLEPGLRPDEPVISTPRELRDALAGLHSTAGTHSSAGLHGAAGPHAAGLYSAGLHGAGPASAGLHSAGLHSAGLASAGLHGTGLHAAARTRPADPSEEALLSIPARRRRRKIFYAVAAIAWLVLVGIGGWLIGLVIGHVPSITATAPRVPAVRASPTGAAAAAAPLVPADVVSFDPLGNDRLENESDVQYATDGDPATAWETEQYNTASFGNLKSGVGLLVDLGKVQALSHVSVRAPAGERLELLAAGSPTVAPTAEQQTTVVAGPVTAVAGKVTALRPTSPVRARWFVVWLTALPPRTAAGASGNAYSGQIAEMSFFG